LLQKLRVIAVAHIARLRQQYQPLHRAAKGSNMNKQENIEEIVELLVVRAAPDKQQQLRKTLSTYSAEELALVKHAIISRRSLK